MSRQVSHLTRSRRQRSPPKRFQEVDEKVPMELEKDPLALTDGEQEDDGPLELSPAEEEEPVAISTPPKKTKKKAKTAAKNTKKSEATPSLSRSSKRNTKKDAEDENHEAQSTITCMSIPVTEEDDDVVECRLCNHRTTFREFRIHNMQTHSNIATTTDDNTIQDRRFYERQLKQLKRFTKAKIFKCPREYCKSSYKSTLGLAYHLETCGKSLEEMESVLVPCDKCDQKFTFPNLQWHKKSQHSENPEQFTRINPIIPAIKLKKRKSAIRAEQNFANADQNLDDDDNFLKKTKRSSTKAKQKKTNNDDDYNENDGNKSDISNSSAVDIEVVPGKNSGKRNYKRQWPPLAASKREFAATACKFLGSKENNSADVYWNTPKRITDDPLSSAVALNNEWINNIHHAELSKYLPQQKESVAFKTIFEITSDSALNAQVCSDYGRLSIFKSQIVDDEHGHYIFNAGGPVIGMSWHPSGNLLAVSTGSTVQEDIDLKIQCSRKSIIQIYSHHYEKEKGQRAVNILTPQLLICADYGYATNLQWCNFWPECWETFSSADFKFIHHKKFPNSSKIGYLASSFEDGSIRIYSLKIKDCMMPHNFSVKESSTIIPLYKKVPEICLTVDAAQYPNIGQVTKFDWHEENRFLIAGYCSGLVAIFDVQTVSKLLRETVTEGKNIVQMLSPFWIFQAHLAPVTAVHFDPACSRYFVTASKDRYLKVWDLHLRKETEARKIGLILDTCWIRGWIHLAVASDGAISNLSSQHTFVRFYQIGTTHGRPNCAEFMNISSISFHKGITIQATENGNITASYFDNFWRESDYDRNKKKHNVVNICKLELDTSSFERIRNEDFPKDDEQYVPFSFDVMEEPKIVLTFYRQRVKTQNIKEPDKHYFEDYVRFFPYLRINKLLWSPQGKYFATGYRNGLLTIVPASFNSLYD